MALCLPAKFQVFIVVVNVLTVLYTATGVMSLIPSLLFTGFFGYIWILFLNCLCMNDYNWLSWILIVIGLITNIAMWFLLYSMKKAGKQLEASIPTAPVQEATAPVVAAPPAAALPPPAATSVRSTAPSPASTSSTASSVTPPPPKPTSPPSPAGSGSTVVK
jgi:hypothetical protein